MAHREPQRRARRRPPDRAVGGFGPWGPPRPPDREPRPDTPPATPPERPAPLRVTGQRRSTRDRAPAARSRAPAPLTRRSPRRRPRPPEDIEHEILGLGSRRGPWLLRQLMEAADDFDHERDQQAARRLRQVRDAIPDSPSVRELLGLTQYRLGNYRSAAKELQAFIELTGSVEQHPVLMDCYRAQHRWARVDDLWSELADASPSAQLVTEGRIVEAGALADRGQISEAIALLSRKAQNIKRPREHHLRLWYALADLEERVGNHARARSLFDRIAAHDPGFADVAARRKALA